MRALVPASAALGAVDSMLGQLYPAGGALDRHVDMDLSWGMSVSLGQPADFACFGAAGPDTAPPEVVLAVESGDVLIGEFGLLPHAVAVPEGGAVPGWWDRADAYGLARCNVLFRRALTVDECAAKGTQRARALGLGDFGTLCRKTGRPTCEMATVLRHLTEELKAVPADRRKEVALQCIEGGVY